MQLFPVSLMILALGVTAMAVLAAVAKRWLHHHARYEPDQLEVIAEGPIVTSFDVLRAYSEARRQNGQSNTLTVAYWIAVVTAAAGLLLLFAAVIAGPR